MITRPLIFQSFMSLEPNGVNFWYFKLNLTIWPNKILGLKYQKSTTLGCNDLGIRKLGFVIIAHPL